MNCPSEASLRTTFEPQSLVAENNYAEDEYLDTLLGLGRSQQRIARADSATMDFLFLPTIPKTAEQILKEGYPTSFSNLSIHSLMLLSCSISASWCSHHSRS